MPVGLTLGQVGDASCLGRSFLSKALNNPDDWSGVQNPVERRKRQNRVRQRAWRKRNSAAGEPKTATMGADSSWEGYGMLVATDQYNLTISEAGSLSIASVSSGYQDVSTYQASITAVGQGKPWRDKLIPPLLSYTIDATLSQPTPAIIFPLSADHCLITLVQYNVVRAILLNMSILSLLDCLPINCRRAFGISILDVAPPENIPLDLRPTPLQQSTPHPFWIKAIPFPAMRDNLIILTGKYDSNDLCYDMGQALYDGFDDVERRGCLVWGDPWSVYGWEVSETFVRKWGFLLKGCTDVIESTNRWREVRGEDRLIVET
ncbi:hypothetical protein BGZ60DRAFT_569125 [Tricladium varicosporioides]|nr:hypothetical protein BGZ60DRAFT_569125 [Hymenoscyphus varicosporioides]